jgi:hypothetical protein
MLIWFNRPQNKEELYNLQHASAHNVVEQIFSVTKNQLSVLKQSPRYAMLVQVCIPPALCALHNFIVQHDPKDTEIDLDEDEEELGGIQVEEDVDLTLFGNLGFGVITHEVQDCASKKWDRLASEMWREYIAFLDANNLM